MKPPKIDHPVAEPLTTAELEAMLKACSDTEMRDKRDEAVIRLMLETRARAGETAVVAIADVDLTNGVVIICKGKGGKGRQVPIGPEIAKTIDRYMRARRTHGLADSLALCRGDRGKSLRYEALQKTLSMRAAKAGVAGFHPHRLRHAAAHRWVQAGGSEGGPMAMAGWTRPASPSWLPRPARSARS